MLVWSPGIDTSICKAQNVSEKDCSHLIWCAISIQSSWYCGAGCIEDGMLLILPYSLSLNWFLFPFWADNLFPGESIPIRLFLAGYDLTPTMRDVNKKFSVRYFLNLVLVDEEDRRYFKQQVQCVWKCICYKMYSYK